MARNKKEEKRKDGKEEGNWFRLWAFFKEKMSRREDTRERGMANAWQIRLRRVLCHCLRLSRLSLRQVWLEKW